MLKKLMAIFGVVVILTLFAVLILKNSPYLSNFAKSKKMIITSSAFEQNGVIPDKYSCRGKNINPKLNFGSVPQQAKSLVLIVDDPDAPSGAFTHWVVFNIPPIVVEVQEDITNVPGTVGKNSTGKSNYVGPCPPSGTHRYFFKLYALDTMLSSLDATAEKSDLVSVMSSHILEQAELMGKFSR